jgi:hypothetical protein
VSSLRARSRSTSRFARASAARTAGSALACLASLVCLAGAAAGTAGCGSNNDAGNGAKTDAGNGGDGAGGSTFTGDDGGGDDGGGCASVSKKAEKIPLDMVLGLDTSFSMDFDDKWINVKAALESFVANPSYADLGIGLQFFPIRKQCSVPDYETLAIDLGLQPQVSGPITQALEAQMMAGGTPTVPLLQGLVAYLQARPDPTRKPVIVLATDGVPDDTCLSPVDGETPNTLANATAVAAAAFAATPSIPTFVIGVGSDLSALDAIARAGGTGMATLVDTGGNAQKQFLDALDSARQSAIPCNFAIPSGTSVDPTETNVEYAPASAPAQNFLYVGDSAGCVRAPTDGWYFDDPMQPTQVILCDAACDMVKADDRGQVNVVFGCPRVSAR